MERVQGIGGFFFRARDPQLLVKWYSDHLGVASMTPAGDGDVWEPFTPDADADAA